MRTASLLLLAPLLISSCWAESPETDAFRGYYAYGFEESLFMQIGKQDRWWLSSLPPCAEPPTSGGSTPILYIELKGRLSSKGNYGHLGKYVRELAPEKFIVCRKLQPDEPPNF